MVKDKYYLFNILLILNIKSVYSVCVVSVDYCGDGFHPAVGLLSRHKCFRIFNK